MGALLKAVLVNSARPLTVKGLRSNKKQTGLPNNDVGWGGVDLSTTIVTPSSPPGLALKVYGEWSEGCAACPVVYQGETWEYKIKLLDDNPEELPFKVTLVWFDKEAGNHPQQQVIVSNLDLSVVRMGGGEDAIHHPNNGRSGKSGPDPINTVEHISIPPSTTTTTPGGGGGEETYTVKVKGTSVPLQSQYFALVISGPLQTPTAEPRLVNQHAAREEKKRGGAGRSD